MPAASLREKLRRAIDGRSLNSVCIESEIFDEEGKRIDGVSNFQLANILSGRTLPWNVRVRTAQMLVALFPHHIRITDFYKGTKIEGIELREME